MTPRKLALTAGISYLIIFFAAIFANFVMLEGLTLDPVATVQDSAGMVKAGIVAFLITVVFDVVVAWALQKLFEENPLSSLSNLFRMMHAAIMGVAVFALPFVLELNTAEEIHHQLDIFNTIWLIGLFFFGIHLILLSRILQKPKFIALFLFLAGIMYILDTVAHFTFDNYQEHADLFLAAVAIPSIFGEMAFSIYLLLNGGKS